jgi:ligand-binding sensor domain-containing protein
MRFRFNLILLLNLLVSLYKAQTPSFNFQKLGSEDGLNNANIFNIEQNQNGLIYFTTQNGIYNYDGYNFNKLQIDSLKSNSLLNAGIKNINELYLSIGNEGVALYNLKTKNYTFSPQLKFKFNADNFIINNEFAYLLKSRITLTIIDLKSGKQITDAISAKDKMNQAFCIFKTIDDKILVGRKDGLYQLVGGEQKKLDALKNNPIYSISQTKDGKLVLGSSGKIIFVKNNIIENEITPKFKKTVTYQDNGEKSIDKIICDNYGRIWFTSYPNENLYLYQNNTVYDVYELLGIPPSLINCVYKDRDENIWIGTFDEGVYFIQNPHYNSISFSYDSKTLNVNRVFIKNELLVAATNNGLYGLNIISNQTKTLSKPDNILKEPINGIEEVNGMIYYSKNNSFDASPSIFLDSKNSYHFKPINGSLFYPLKDNKIVVADRQADILLYDNSATKLLDTLISFPDYRVSVNAFLKHNDSLYIGTNNGLFIYDFKSKKYNHLIRADLNFKINDIAILNNKLYVAHESGVTEVINGKLIQQVGNLRLNSVKKIKQINNQIWLATLDGVFICDNNFSPLKILNKTSGLLSNSVSDIVFNNETICIATARGVAITNISNIVDKDSKPKPVSINYISTNGKTIESLTNSFTLNSNQDNLTINFYSPLFSKPNKQFYKYKIDKEDWNTLNENSLSLNSLSGGKHKIEISVSTDNIVWSESTVVNISKEEKLSETNWVYWLITISGLLIISSVSFFIIKRVKSKAKRRLQEEQQVNLLKHQAMNALLSPHFIFNSLTSIQNYINTNNSLKASEYLAKFSRLIRMIIERAAQSEITLHDELARLTYYLELEKERFKNKFDFKINVDETLNRAELKIPNMIIQPHVENCIIHGILPKLEHGTLTISFKNLNNNKTLITIEDDGIGLIKAKEHAKTGHKSLGTSTIKNILEINSKLTGKKQNVTMVDKSTLNPSSSGTIITIELEQ